MVPISRVTAGVAKYCDSEILPKLAESSWQRVATGVFIGILVKRGESAVQDLVKHPVLKSMNIVDGSNIDLDLLRDVLRDRISDSGMVVALPVVGTMTFYREDVDRIYSCIVG